LKLVWRLIRQEPHGESLLEITQKLPKNLTENSKYGPQTFQKTSTNSHSRSLNPGIAKMSIFHTNDASFESALGAPWEPILNPFGLIFAMKSHSKTPSALQCGSWQAILTRSWHCFASVLDAFGVHFRIQN